MVFNPNNSIGSKWETSRDFTGNGQISFYVTDNGQVQFTTITLSGTGHEGQLIFVAPALVQS